MVILDSKKIGFMKELNSQIRALNSNEISTISVIKDSIASKKYGSDSGVIIITTKKYILDTFFKDFIMNSPLIEKIPTSDKLSEIGVVNDNPKSKNQPFDELSKYIFTNSNNEKVKKVSKIIFINPEDSIKINTDWKNGAIEIFAIIEE
jgi:hypothetical protein